MNWNPIWIVPSNDNLKKIMRPAAMPGALCLAALLSAGFADAGVINFVNGTGSTVYGATNYVQLTNPGPTYIANNVTLNNDILSSPGGGYQTANPVVGNNVAQSGIVNVGYNFGWTGGVAGLSGTAFGTGFTSVTGAGIGFGLSDTTVGCCSASYSITSVNDNYVVGAGGFNGNFGAYLSISGTNFTANDAAVASAIVEYSVNGGGFVFMPQMVLAAGGNCNNVVLGGSGAAILETGCAGNNFRGLSIDNLGNFIFAAGTTIKIVATVTAYADPASGDIINSYSPDANLISATGATLPDFTGLNTGVTPEPGTFGLAGSLLAVLCMLRRRKAV